MSYNVHVGFVEGIKIEWKIYYISMFDVFLEK